MPKVTPQICTPEQTSALIGTLEARFNRYPNRHVGITWADVLACLEANPQQLWSLHEMEATGGEPDVIGRDATTGEYLLCDCAAESPKGRRSTCYDRAALESRKDFPPQHNAVDMAADMGIALLTEAEYALLQQYGPFDTKTSSWLHTPADVRALGGALFGDCRYGRVFTYHNGAQSYYGARGFRGILRVG